MFTLQGLTKMRSKQSPYWNFGLFKRLILVMVFLGGIPGAVLVGDTFFEQNRVMKDPLTLYAELVPSSVKNTSDVLSLKLWGRLPQDYHIYSIEKQGEFAPPPTQLVVFSKLLHGLSPLKESEPKVVEDRAFDMLLKVHKNDFWLEKSYSIKGNNLPGEYVIPGALVYQVCDNLICSLPLEKAFKVSLVIEKQ